MLPGNLLADLVVFIHFLFILFVIFGGILPFFNIKWALVHIPALLWGTCLELFGWICPLTPLENMLRNAAGESGYQNSFIEHYIKALVYPVGLTRDVQIILGTLLITLNVIIYTIVIINTIRNNAKNHSD